jgi:hypothetical protein
MRCSFIITMTSHRVHEHIYHHIHRTSLIVEITITAVCFFSRNEPTILAGAMNGQIIHRTDGVIFSAHAL